MSPHALVLNPLLQAFVAVCRSGAGRHFAQALERANDCEKAAREAEVSGDLEQHRHALDALTHADLVLDGTAIELATELVEAQKEHALPEASAAQSVLSTTRTLNAEQERLAG